MSIVLLCFGVITGFATATALWSSGAGLGLALLGYMAGCAVGGTALCLCLLWRAAAPLARQPARVVTSGS